MKKTDIQVNLLTFFFISMLALTVAGLLFKFVFVVYNDSQFSALSVSEITYALFWGCVLIWQPPRY